MYSLEYKVTTSTCDSEGRLKLYSALQMMQDCSEMWIDSEPSVKRYFAEQNMAQLLATRQVEVARVPEYKEKLTVTSTVYEMKTMHGIQVQCMVQHIRISDDIAGHVQAPFRKY